MSATSEESPIPRWKERLLALLVSFVLMILGGEIFCRWQIHQANAHNLEAVLTGRTRPGRYDQLQGWKPPVGALNRLMEP